MAGMACYGSSGTLSRHTTRSNRPFLASRREITVLGEVKIFDTFSRCSSLIFGRLCNSQDHLAQCTRAAEDDLRARQCGKPYALQRTSGPQLEASRLEK